jgi:hypothetical protein
VREREREREREIEREKKREREREREKGREREREIERDFRDDKLEVFCSRLTIGGHEIQYVSSSDVMHNAKNVVNAG